jgi:hypothetical protein
MGNTRAATEARLFSSTDFFRSEKKYVDMGMGKDAKGLVGIGGVSNYIVAALKPIFDRTGGIGQDEMIMMVTQDSKTWSRAKFPHGHNLKENAYTIIDSSTHSIMVDVLANPWSSYGTTFVSNSNGTYFVRSLEHTNRNDRGMVDYEKLVGVEGTGIANVVVNWDRIGGVHQEQKKLSSRITFDDGHTWKYINPPEKDANGERFSCSDSSLESCSLHLHSVTTPHNYGVIFSSSAPGLVMGVGSVGEYLESYEDSDTFLSIDGGESWTMVSKGARKYEFGDQGVLLVTIDDEELTDEISYSTDIGQTWQTYNIGVRIRARLFTTLPDSTSKKFLVLGTLSKKDSSKDEKHVIVTVDFNTLGKRKCKDGDFEKWYARVDDRGRADCLMGHKVINFFLLTECDL